MKNQSERMQYLAGLPDGTVVVDACMQAVKKINGRWCDSDHETAAIGDDVLEDWCADGAMWPPEAVITPAQARCSDALDAIREVLADGGQMVSAGREVDAVRIMVQSNKQAIRLIEDAGAAERMMTDALRNLDRAMHGAESTAPLADLPALLLAWVETAKGVGMSGTPWACDVCGEPGVKSAGPEGYCEKHRPRSVRSLGWGALDAIREALGCEPGGEVEAVLALRADAAGAENALDAMSVQLLSSNRPPAPTPGTVLRPEDFGRDEAGVLRLAALLAEAPEGAVVRDPYGNVNQKVAGVHNGRPWLAWCRPGFSAVRGAERDIASLAPLTVVAWPEGGAK